MTGKERVKAALAFQPVDRVPTALLDGGVWIADHAGYSFEELTALEDGGGQIVYDYYEKLKSDIVFTGGGCFGMAMRAIGAKSNFSERGKSAEVKPLNPDPEFYKDFDISSIRKMLLDDPGIQGLIRQTKKLRELVGQDKYIATISGAPFTLAGSMIGVQDFMMDLFDEDIDMEPVFAVGTALCAEFNNVLLEAGADMAGLGDPVASGALISQDMYEEFALPLLKKVIPQLKGAEQILLHICGNTTPRLKSLIGTGIHAYSLDAVDLKTALDIAGGHYAIMGNLSPVDVMSGMDADSVRNLARERAQLAGRNGGFVLMPGCDLPNATPLENVLAMVDGAITA